MNYHLGKFALVKILEETLVTALTACTSMLCPFSVEKSAEMSVFICESRIKMWVAEGFAPRLPVAVVRLEHHSYDQWRTHRGV